MDRVTFLEELELKGALSHVASSGVAFLPSALVEEARQTIETEVRTGPIRPYREQFGQVRQEIEGFDVSEPFLGFPAIAELCHSLTGLVREAGQDVRGLRSWRVNEAGVVVYRPGSIGITPHLDGKRYRRLVAVVTIFGTAPFSIYEHRSGAPIATFEPGPGSITLLRGPGLAWSHDGRPFHSVGSPQTGDRCAIGLRMTTSPREVSLGRAPGTGHPGEKV